MNLWNNRNFTPMLLNEEFKPFDSDEYLFELKYDGIRALIFADDKEVYIESRNRNDLTMLFPELQKIKDGCDKKTIFDGEIICLEDGKPSFKNVQKRVHLKNINKIKEEMDSNPAVFMVFDVLFYDGTDLTSLDLIKRKRVLNKFKDTEVFVKSKAYEKDGIKLFKFVKKEGLEGIVAKRKDGKYYINERTSEFIKIKNIQRDEFYIGGYIEKENVLSLILVTYDNKKYIYAGKVIIGKKQMISKVLLKEKRVKNYLANFEEEAIFIKPRIICFIEYLEKTKNGHLRHPVFKGVKDINYE